MSKGPSTVLWLRWFRKQAKRLEEEIVSYPEGRAVTRELKQAVMDRLLDAWLRVPGLRLGQLVACAADIQEPVLFYLEDMTLLEAIEEEAGRKRRL